MNKLPWRADIRLAQDQLEPLATEMVGRCDEVRQLGEGWDFVTYLVDKTYVLRVPKRAECESILEREQHILQHLQQADLGLPTPVYIKLARTGVHPWQVAAYRLLPGTPASDIDDPGVLDAIPGQLGQFLSRLHAIDVGEALTNPWDDDEADDPWEMREFEAAEAAYPDDLKERVRAFVHLPSRPEPDVPHALTHADLGDEHILVDPQTGELTGVIDWADAFTGCRSRDYLGLYFMGGRGYAARAFDAAGVLPTEDEWRWLAHSAVGTAIGHVLYGFRDNRPAMLASTLEKLPRLLRDVGL